MLKNWFLSYRKGLQFQADSFKFHATLSGVSYVTSLFFPYYNPQNFAWSVVHTKCLMLCPRTLQFLATKKAHAFFPGYQQNLQAAIMNLCMNSREWIKVNFISSERNDHPLFFFRFLLFNLFDISIFWPYIILRNYIILFNLPSKQICCTEVTVLPRLQYEHRKILKTLFRKQL